MRPSPQNAALLVAVHSLLVSGSPIEAEQLAARQSCPSIHIFGARETTVSPGFGTAGQVVNLITGAFPGATSEAISYPACGGQSSCGGVQYGASAAQGTTAVATAVNSFHQRCPNTQIVLVGYSQGGQIMDNAVCGGPDSGSGITSTTPGISASALNMVKAAIFMGSPRYVAGLSYNVGTCTAQGVSLPPPQPPPRKSSNLYSSPPAPAATSAAPTRPPRSKTTVTAPTRTAAQATTPTCTSSTVSSTASRRCSLSVASSPQVVAATLRRQRAR